jgi:uncharacterized alkaline shock family protein YloU
MFDKETDLGEIHFPASVIERIVKDAVNTCDEKVFLNKYKGKYMSMVPGGDYTAEEEEAGINITVYVVMSFGASIGKYSKRMLAYIYDNVEKVMGIRPSSVTIVVTGLKSKDNIAKRHIEITE